MSNDDATHSTMSKDASDQAAVREAATIGDGSRALKDELLPGNANNPGSPDLRRNGTKRKRKVWTPIKALEPGSHAFLALKTPQSTESRAPIDWVAPTSSTAMK